MAEIGTLIAIIQGADRVIELCRFWIETVRDAPSDLRSILIETSMLRSVFENVQFLAKCDDAASPTLQKLSGPNGSLDHCQQILVDLEKLFPSGDVYTRERNASRKRKLAATLASLAWPLKEPKAQKLLQELVRYKTAINLALTVESVQDIKSIKLKTTKISEMLTDAQLHEFYRWLQHTDPSSIHYRVRRQIEDGTCSWMMRTPEWSAWLAGKARCLWIHGIPGAGKSVLMSYLVGATEKHCQAQASRKSVPIYYYCYFGHDQDEAGPLLRWLIVQLSRRQNRAPTALYEVYREGRQPDLPELMTGLEACLSDFETVYFMVDAADESKPREDLLKVFRDLATDPRFRKIQLFVTSREYLDIETVLQEISQPISMNNEFVAEDIRRHVRAALQPTANRRFRHWPQSLLAEAEEALSARAKGMFRWVVCQIDRLHRLKAESSVIKNTLATLPKTLDETYERIFLEIPEVEWPLVRQCLQWIEYHNQIYRDGIPFAILLAAVRSGDYDIGENEYHLDEELLREICGCLIQISQGVGFPYSLDGTEESQLGKALCSGSVVSLAHYTVREFIESERISISVVSYFKLSSANIRIPLTRKILRFALDSWTGARFTYLGNKNGYQALTTDFDAYSTTTAICVLRRWALEITKQDEICDLFVELFDSSRGQLMAILSVLKDCECLGDILDAIGIWSCLNYWDISWLAGTGSRQSRTLLSIILLDDGSDSRLARRFLDNGPNTSYLSKDSLHFEMAIRGGFTDDLENNCIFRGPLLEIVAQFCMAGPCHNSLRLMLECQHEAENLTAILLSFIGAHGLIWSRAECDDVCLVQRLLDLGADHNAQGYQVTPLQIAVLMRDVHGIEVLLGAGADPNSNGYLEGIWWDSSSLLHNFYCLKGLHVLEIIERFDRPNLDFVNPEYYDSEEVIKVLLIKHGAKEI